MMLNVGLIGWDQNQLDSAMLYMKQSFHKLCQVVLTQPSRMQLVNDGRYVLSGGVGALGLVTLDAIRSVFRCIGCAVVCTELQSLFVPFKLGKASITACLERINF